MVVVTVLLGNYQKISQEKSFTCADNYIVERNVTFFIFQLSNSKDLRSLLQNPYYKKVINIKYVFTIV